MMSYRTLNQIFYTNNKFDDPKMIQRMEQYFMNLSIQYALSKSDHNIEKNPLFMKIPSLQEVMSVKNMVDLSLMQNDITHVESPIFSKGKEAKENGFVNKDRDALFWCIFAHQYGEMEYAMIRTNYGKRKVDEKMKIYSWLKDNKEVIKKFPSMKITNVMYQEMLSELMCVQSDTGFLSLIAFALYYKINIYLVNEIKKTYLEFLGQTEEEEKSSQKSTNHCFLFKLDRGYRLSYEPMFNIIESMIKLENYQKPLKAISNWKVVELEELAKKLGLHEIS